jgi:cation diffusion facilitator CzcD-associated flavoprotein CzcO
MMDVEDEAVDPSMCSWGVAVSKEYFDVVIVGAGLSGIGTAYHLQDKCPGKSYVILEGREELGGTWDLFRYPGVRSDSDMHTLGYNFKPWREAKAIADGPSILKYVRETAVENDIDKHIRTLHLVKRAHWSSADAAWTVECERKDTGETVSFNCSFLLMCSGYYSYESGNTPDFVGCERFRGDIIHPQKWPEALDYKNKRVVVIGSGATAITLVPAMARQAEHVVMLQRTPTYVLSLPDKDIIANLLRKVLPEQTAYAITRWKNVSLQQYLYKRMRAKPEKSKRMLVRMVRKKLAPDYDVETHFTPRYDPWDQRLCVVPNGDLFQAINSGKVSVVTDHIDTFTETGLRLHSGGVLEADIIVTATGLSLIMLGGTAISVDGHPVDFAETFTYMGMMYSEVPNLISTFGYINASWTLRSDLTAEWTCRLLNYMDESGHRQCTPRLRPQDLNMEARPYIDNFTPGYIQRVMHLFPKQGTNDPWVNTQDYGGDRKMFRRPLLEDGALEFNHSKPNTRDASTLSQSRSSLHQS